ncbi:MAG: CxxC-x17-CxxC domain-containing protein, partial [Candidatus Thermoplasmatota archaeon]|nr:CxxC-x17-CxxC domain-containing protein [Candidatus Thermoplasmatota archaeon]
MVSTKVTCSACEKETTVPFKPSEDRPVYCQECYQKKKKEGGGRRRGR